MRRMVLLFTVLILLVSFTADRLLVNTVTPVKISYPSRFGNRINIPADNPTTAEGIVLGRMLFYEPLLSANNRFSCGSCHQQKLAFTDGKRFSEGFDGITQPRNTMSLANLLWVRNFFWDGRAKGLETQAETPLTGLHEMGQTLAVSSAKLEEKKVYNQLFNQAFGSPQINGDRIMKALAQFERTLVSANSGYDQYLDGEYKPTASELNGMNLFYGNPEPAKGIRGAACGRCHGGPKTYSELFHNNGLDSLPVDVGRQSVTGLDIDLGRFRVVTLRNIALTGPYMHDGRFATLEQVVDHYSDHILGSVTLSPVLRNNSNRKDGHSLDLTVKEKRDIIAFLRILTDSTFVSDPKFSDPFKRTKR